MKLEIPKYAGHYSINENFNISLQKKPNFINRFFIKLLLGWRWIDAVTSPEIEEIK